MCCLEGALSYFMNCKLGYMRVNEKYRVGSLPYEIMAYTHEDQEKDSDQEPRFDVITSAIYHVSI